MKQFKISEQVLQGLMQYLATKPYSEVAQGIEALSRLEEIKEDTIEKVVK